GKVVVCEGRLSRRDLVHDPRDCCWRGGAHQLNKARTLTQALAGLGLQIVHDLLDQAPEIKDSFLDTHVASHAFSINDFVAAHQHLGKILRQRLPARKEIDNEYASAGVAEESCRG